jgi:hypothetical protein
MVFVLISQWSIAFTFTTTRVLIYFSNSCWQQCGVPEWLIWTHYYALCLTQKFLVEIFPAKCFG